jgi:hypothetical protein
MPNPATITTTVPSTNDATITYLRDLASKGFWGTLTIKMQHGSVIHITREESIPADKLISTPNYRSTYESSKS